MGIKGNLTIRIRLFELTFIKNDDLSGPANRSETILAFLISIHPNASRKTDHPLTTP
jgi:hypothetical protein